MMLAYGQAYSICGERLAILVSPGKYQERYRWDRTYFTTLITNPMTPGVKTGGKHAN